MGDKKDKDDPGAGSGYRLPEEGEASQAGSRANRQQGKRAGRETQQYTTGPKTLLSSSWLSQPVTSASRIISVRSFVGDKSAAETQQEQFVPLDVRRGSTQWSGPVIHLPPSYILS